MSKAMTSGIAFALMAGTLTTCNEQDETASESDDLSARLPEAEH
jgi:hypothetical protein